MVDNVWIVVISIIGGVLSAFVSLWTVLSLLRGWLVSLHRELHRQLEEEYDRRMDREGGERFNGPRYSRRRDEPPGDRPTQ